MLDRLLTALRGPTFEVVPHSGIGPVKLGATRAESRAAMGLPVDSFKKTPSSRQPLDAYLKNAFQVFFDAEDRVEYVEVSRSTAFRISYRGADLFRLKADESVSRVSADAAVWKEDPEYGFSFVFPELELALSRADDQSPHLDTVGVGAPGYFSKRVAG